MFKTQKMWAQIILKVLKNAQSQLKHLDASTISSYLSESESRISTLLVIHSSIDFY